MCFRRLLPFAFGLVVVHALGACGDPAESGSTDTGLVTPDVQTGGDTTDDATSPDGVSDGQTGTDAISDGSVEGDAGLDVVPPTDTLDDVGPDVVVDPCDSVDCGTYGSCVADPTTRCECDSGYVPAGLTCVEDLIPAQIANLPASVSTAVTQAGSFDVSLVDRDRVGEHTFSVETNGCGLVVAISALGKVTWTCPATGLDCDVTVTVSQAGGHSDGGVLSVACGAATPNLTANAPTSAAEHATYSWTPTCVDPNSLPTTLSVAATDTCGGALSGGSYTFTPTETDGGTTCQVAVRCSNGELGATGGARVAIAEVNAAPQLTNLPAAKSALWNRSGNFVATATDSDLPAQSLAFSLASTTCPFSVSVAAATGVASFTCNASTATCEATIRVSDGVTNTSAALSVTCTNTTPTVSGVAITPAPAYRNTTLTCTYNYSDADGDANASTIAWYVGAGGNPVGTGTTLASGFGPGDAVRCRVTPNDGLAAGTPAEASVTIANRAPSVTNVAIAPTPAYRNSSLSCTYTFNDPDADPDASTIAWYIGSGTSPVGTGSTLTSGYGLGDVVRCRVTPNDGRTAGTAAEATATIVNRAPSVSDISISPSNPRKNTTVTCTYTFTDADNDADVSTIAWYYNNSAAPVATGATYRRNFGSGDVVECRVTPNDGITAGAVGSATIIVGNKVPTVSNVTITPTTAYANTPLACTYTFSDADGDPDQSTIAWYIGTNTTPVGTGATLSSGYRSGDVVRCRVTPNDSFVDGNPVAKTVTISNHLPTVSNVTIAPGTAYRNTPLTCTYTYTDTDGDANASTIAWYIGNGGASVGTGATLSSGYGAGDVVRCRVTPNDGFASGTAVEKTVTIGNRAPTVSNVAIAPTTAYRNTPLSCTYTYADPDGDPNASTIAWYIGTGTSPVGTGASLSSGFQAGDVVRCRVTPNDGTVTASTVEASVTIRNRVPTVTNVAIAPAVAYRNTQLTCTYSFSDADGDANQSTIAWYVNDGVSPIATTATVSTGFRGGDVVRCRVTPHDGVTAGAVVGANITVINRVPTVSNVRISPTAPTVEGETLTCLYGYSDPDSDADVSVVQWIVEGGVVATGTTFADHFPGDLVACRVTASDGVDSGNTLTSEVVLAPGPVLRASLGSYHGCSVEDGALSCWGRNDQSQLGDGTLVDRPTPSIVAGFATGVTGVATGQQHTCAVKDGTVYCWGGNASGQTGATASTRELSPVTVTLPAPARTVIAGPVFTCATAGGELYCWGSNSQGQLGDGTQTTRHTPGAAVDIAGTVQAVAVGNNHTCAVADGAAYCWGLSNTGQLGYDTGRIREPSPLPVPGLDSGVTAISAGLLHTCAIQGGALFCWGSNTDGRIGDGTAFARWSPTAVDGMDSGVTHVAAGAMSCATRSRALYCWGTNTNGELGRGYTSQGETAPALVDGLGTGVSRVVAASSSACALQDQELFCWGLNDGGQLRRGGYAYIKAPTTIDGAPSFSLLATGEAHSCGVLSGALYCWGDNTYGRLGIAGTGKQSVPTLVQTMNSGVTAVSLGQNHSCAVRSGAAYCWGRNNFGQLGDGTKTDHTAPTVVPGLGSGVTHIVAMNASTCAVKEAAVLCWGANTAGQVGDATLVEKTSPTAALVLDTGVTYLAGRQAHACAIKSGALFCWGLNGTGQIGDNSQTSRSTPTAVTNMGSNVTAVDVGAQHSCAIKSGAHYCWGNNGYGQLGDGSVLLRKTPVAVNGHGSSGTGVFAGLFHTCGVRNKVLSCWGNNDNGQLGDGSIDLRPLPVLVTGFNGTAGTLQALGGSSSCSTRTDGVVYCWGMNSRSQLGFTGPFSEYPL